MPRFGFSDRALTTTKKAATLISVYCPKQSAFMEEIKVRQAICDKIGEQKIDIAVSKNGLEAFFKHVILKGVLLYG